MNSTRLSSGKKESLSLVSVCRCRCRCVRVVLVLLLRFYVYKYKHVGMFKVVITLPAVESTQPQTKVGQLQNLQSDHNLIHMKPSHGARLFIERFGRWCSAAVADRIDIKPIIRLLVMY